MPRPLLPLVVTLCLVGSALAACGDDGDAAGAPSTSAATTAAPATTAATATTPAATTQPATTATTATTAPGPTTTVADPTQITFTIGVDPPGGTRTVPLGADVTITVHSDGDEEVHIHGYDLEQRVAAGVPAVVRFTADRAGSFEVESHTTDDLLFTLVVT